MNHHEPTYDEPRTRSLDPRWRITPPVDRVHEERPDWPQPPANPGWRIPTDPPPA